MSSRVIETFLPVTAAPRGAEPPRADDERSGFAPALDQALHADGRRGPPGGAAASDDDEPTRETVADGEIDDEASSDVAEDALATSADESLDSDGGETGAAQQAVAAAAALTIIAPAVEPSAAPADGAAEAAPAAATAPTPPATPNQDAALSAGLPLPGAPAPSESGDASPASLAAAVDQTGAVAAAREETTAATPIDHELASVDNTTSDRVPADAEDKAHIVAEEPAQESLAEVDSTSPSNVSDDADAEPTSELRVEPTPAATTVDAAAASDSDLKSDGGGEPVARGGDAAATPAAAAADPTSAASSAGAERAPSRTASGRPLHAAPPRGESDGAEHVDRGRFLGRVEGAIRTAQQRDGRVQVRLSPPELGSLRIELTIEQGVLSARLEAETPAARKMLLDNLPALRERLAQQDVRVDRFDVDVRREGAGSGGGPQDRPAGDPTPRHGDERRERDAANQRTTVRPSHAPRSRTTPDAALDVRV